MNVYPRIKDLRKDFDKTQKEIALWAAIKLARYYKVSLDYLVGNSNNKN